MPAIIGLTGGIASGKSTVSRFFSELGARVIDADIIAREVVEPGSDGLRAIQDAFGDEVLDVHGALDRARLGAIVFEDSSARATLNAITHPRIAQLMWHYASQAEEVDGHAWVIYDAALIVENKIQEMLQGLIVVSCDPAVQLARLISRDGFTESEAQARIASQLPLADKVAVADHVIDNSRDLAHTEHQTRAVFDTLQQHFSSQGQHP